MSTQPEPAYSNHEFHQTMGWVDLVPRAGNLYIGGLYALYRDPDLFKRANITHILSVLDFEINKDDQFSNYEHLHIRLEDDPNEDLLKYFDQTSAFIDDALRRHDGGVFVHCAMGKSRSATVVCAYLMRKDGVSPSEALKQVCEGRPVCAPNPGFMEQLSVYYAMLRAESEGDRKRLYEKWQKERYRGDYWSWDNRSRMKKL